MEHIKTDDTVYFSVNFYHPASGYSVASDAIPAWYVYENNGATSILNGGMTARTDIVGSYYGTFVASVANSFVSNNFYDVQVSGSVDNISGMQSVKTFVLDDIYDVNIVQVSGVAAAPGTERDVNVIEVSGEAVDIGSFGGTGASVTDIANAVWDEGLAAHVGAGSTGQALVTASGNLIGMVGTDGAALATTALSNLVWTDSRAGYLDSILTRAAGSDLESVSGVLVSRTRLNADYFSWGTDEVITDAASRTASKATGFATSSNLESVSGVLVARTIVAANYFDPVTDVVSQVTLVDTVTDITNVVNSNMVQVSGSIDTLRNLGYTYDGTGYTDNYAPAQQQQSQNIYNNVLAISGDVVNLDQDIYFANVKYIKDSANAQDEFGIQWFKNDQPVSSGELTNPAISVYNTSTGVAIFEHQSLSYASSNLGVVRYNNSSVMASGEPYLIETSGTIDASVQTWKTIVGIDSL